MYNITDKLQGLLRKAIEDRGGVENVVSVFGSKRSTIYRWLNGKTKAVNDDVYGRMIYLLKPYLSKEEYEGYINVLNGSKTRAMANFAFEKYASAAQKENAPNDTEELYRQFKEELILKLLDTKELAPDDIVKFVKFLKKN